MPSATPGALLAAPPTRAQRMEEQRRAAEAAPSGSDSDEEAVRRGGGGIPADAPGRAAAAAGDDPDGATIDDLWPRGEPAPPPPLPAAAQQRRRGTPFVWTPKSDEPPDDCLALEWAAGFAPSAGLAAVNGNELLYACGAIGVVQSAAASRLQRHLCGHRAAVRSLCVHPNGRVVATAGRAAVAADGAPDDAAASAYEVSACFIT